MMDMFKEFNANEKKYNPLLSDTKPIDPLLNEYKNQVLLDFYNKYKRKSKFANVVGQGGDLLAGAVAASAAATKGPVSLLPMGLVPLIVYYSSKPGTKLEVAQLNHLLNNIKKTGSKSPEDMEKIENAIEKLKADARLALKQKTSIAAAIAPGTKLGLAVAKKLGL